MKGFYQCWELKLPEASHRPTLQASSSEDQDSLFFFLVSFFLQILFVTSRTVILSNFWSLQYKENRAKYRTQRFSCPGSVNPVVSPLPSLYSHLELLSVPKPGSHHLISSPWIFHSCSLLPSSFRPLQRHPWNLTSFEIHPYLHCGKTLTSVLPSFCTSCLINWHLELLLSVQLSLHQAVKSMRLVTSSTR